VIPEEPQQSLDFRDYLRPLRNRWWLIVITVVVVTAGTYFYYDRQPEVYSATSQLFVETSSLEQVLFGSGGGRPAETIDDLSLLLQTTPVAEQVAADTGFTGDPRALLGSISAAGDGESSFIFVTAQGGTASGAANLANAFSRAFVSIRRQDTRQQAESALEDAQAQLDQLGDDPAAEAQRSSLLSRVEQLELVGTAGTGVAGIELVEPAVAPAEPIEPQPTRNAIFAFVVSLALAVAIAFGLERFDRRIGRLEDVEEIYKDQAVLTELPQVGMPAPVVNREAVVSDALREPFRRLQMNLDLAADISLLESIVIVSAAPEEGKSIVARNLAIAYREAGKWVALVDADFRKPSVARLFDLDGETGLANVLAGSIDLELALQPVNGYRNGNSAMAAVQTAMNGAAVDGALSALTAGRSPSNPAAALATGRMMEILEEAAETYDTVLIDSPPILAVSDALPLLTAADGVIIVTRVGVSSRESARRMLKGLEQVPDVNVLGVVVNGVPPRDLRNRAYDYAYYDKYVAYHDMHYGVPGK
jgi:Mrp family chromosome partitioning ATPase/capsular polysaccharide biosynthesis protein